MQLSKEQVKSLLFHLKLNEQGYMKGSDMSHILRNLEIASQSPYEPADLPIYPFEIDRDYPFKVYGCPHCDENTPDEAEELAIAISSIYPKTATGIATKWVLTECAYCHQVYKREIGVSEY